MRPALVLIWLARDGCRAVADLQPGALQRRHVFSAQRATPGNGYWLNQIREGAVTRLLLAAISGGDAQRRAALSQACANGVADGAFHLGGERGCRKVWTATVTCCWHTAVSSTRQ